MAENGELNPVRQCFILEGSVLLSLNETNKKTELNEKFVISSLWNWLCMSREFYCELTKCSYSKKWDSTGIAIDVSTHFIITHLSF